MSDAKAPLPRRLYAVLLHAAIFLAFCRYLVAPLVDRDELAATDFTVFYTGWSLVLSEPARVYDVEAQRRAQAAIMGDRHFAGGVMTFYYPPHAAVALAPFAKLGFQNAFRVWTALQVACLVLLIRWLAQLAGLRDRLDRWVLVTAVLAFLPVLYALQIGQLSIAMTLALVGFWRAFAQGRRRDAQAALWLLVLTVKPQLLPVPLLLVLASRRFAIAAWLAAAAAPAALVATLVLGARAWLDYPARARHLEGFVAGGSHDHMLNLRGLLTRVAGAGHDASIMAVSTVAFAAASLAIYRLLRRSSRGGAVPAVGFGAAIALALPFNVHLHLQDGIVWAVPIAISLAYLHGRGADERRFALFALVWPTIYVATSAIEAAAGRLLPVPPAFVLAVILAGWSLRLAGRDQDGPGVVGEADAPAGAAQAGQGG